MIKNDRTQSIQRIALQVLTECAVSFGIGLLVSMFVATPLSLAIIMGAVIIQCIVSLAARVIGNLAEKKGFTQIAEYASFIAPASCFAIGTAENGQALIHEMGHAVAAKMLYREANVRITLSPWDGGFTTFSTLQPNALGAQLGKNGARAVVSLAGPLTAVLAATGGLATAVALREKHPQISQYLFASSFYSLLYHFYYARSALNTPATSLSHDFVAIRHFLGLHPKVVLAAIVAIPLLVTAGMLYHKQQSF